MPIAALLAFFYSTAAPTFSDDVAPLLAHGPVALSAAFLIAAQLGDMAWPIYNINETSVRQAVTPDRLLGHVNSAGHPLFWGAHPLGSLAGGAIAQTIGIRQTMLIAALGYLLSNLWFTFSPIRHLRQLFVA
jgi:hypothetical protein